MKKSNAAKIDEKFAKPASEKLAKDDRVTGNAFPTYTEYERVPGKKLDE